MAVIERGCEEFQRSQNAAWEAIRGAAAETHRLATLVAEHVAVERQRRENEDRRAAEQEAIRQEREKRVDADLKDLRAHRKSASERAWAVAMLALSSSATLISGLLFWYLTSRLPTLP